MSEEYHTTTQLYGNKIAFEVSTIKCRNFDPMYETMVFQIGRRGQHISDTLSTSVANTKEEAKRNHGMLIDRFKTLARKLQIA